MTDTQIDNGLEKLSVFYVTRMKTDTYNPFKEVLRNFWSLAIIPRI